MGKRELEFSVTQLYDCPWHYQRLDGHKGQICFKKYLVRLVRTKLKAKSCRPWVKLQMDPLLNTVAFLI